jgi:hypothetical protein
MEGSKMRTSFKLLVTKSARTLAITALSAGVFVTAGCASGGVSNVSGVGGGTPQAMAQPTVRANVIYVSSFDVSADQVKLDNTGIAQRLKSLTNSTSPASEQDQTANDTREQVADEIVQQLQSMGLPAMRSDGPAPASMNALLVQGNFETIDAGNRRRRLLIGLGAGKSEVGATVRIVYQPASGAPMQLQSFSADEDSGHMPGAAETAGVGAAAGHVATSGVATVGMHGVSEQKHGSISAEAKRLADSIAKQVAEANATNGWVPVQRSGN